MAACSAPTTCTLKRERQAGRLDAAARTTSRFTARTCEPDGSRAGRARRSSPARCAARGRRRRDRRGALRARRARSSRCSASRRPRPRPCARSTSTGTARAAATPRGRRDPAARRASSRSRRRWRSSTPRRGRAAARDDGRASGAAAGSTPRSSTRSWRSATTTAVATCCGDGPAEAGPRRSSRASSSRARRRGRARPHRARRSRRRSTRSRRSPRATPWASRASPSASASSSGFDAAALRDLRRAGLLHDIGKLGVSNRDPRQAGEADRRGVRADPPPSALHARDPARVPASRRFADDAAAHHERLDGRGYHRGVRAGALSPRGARVLAVADVFEALTADRPYRGPMAPDEALAIMRRDVGATSARARSARSRTACRKPSSELRSASVQAREPRRTRHGCVPRCRFACRTGIRSTYSGRFVTRSAQNATGGRRLCARTC